MVYIVALLIVIIAVLLVYVYTMNRQLERMCGILNRRLKEATRQVVSVALINRHINKLANCINECLKTEENLRLNSVKEEKKFKELMVNISHDLRTPLTAIKGYQQMLEKEALTEGQQNKLTIAMKHTEKLGQLIEHFFEYAYMVNHVSRCNLEKMNLTNQVAEHLVGSIPMFEERGMEVDYDDSIQAYVMADKEMIERIIQNLIKNCMQHAAGPVQVRIITYEKEVAGSMAGISFSNKVPENHNIDVDRLFDRFYTTDNARKQSTGLGLAIVKLLTEQMNGQVSAKIKNGMLDIRVLFPKVMLEERKC